VSDILKLLKDIEKSSSLNKENQKYMMFGYLITIDFDDSFLYVLLGINFECLRI